MSTHSTVALGDLMARRTGTVDPSKYPDEVFDLYSIPAFDSHEPVVIAGRSIGSAKQVVEPGDVLLSKIVPHVRRSWVVGKREGRRIIASGEWIVFRDDRIHPAYLRLLLVDDQFHVQYMNTVAGVGGSLLRARPAHVAKLLIRIPPLGEQKRIADVLDRVGALQDQRRAALAQLDSLAQSVFVDMFGNPVTNDRGWVIARVGDHAQQIRGVTYAKDDASPAPKAGYLPILRANNITADGLTFDNLVFVPAPRISARQRIRKNDVVIATSSGSIDVVGKAADAYPVASAGHKM